jgi:hypothetical protein
VAQEPRPRGWFYLLENPNWAAYEVVSAPARSGRRAARLHVRADAATGPKPAQVYGVIQEPTSPDFPDTLSGWYRVESWDRGGTTTDLYLQAVVIVWGDPRTPYIVNPELKQPGASPPAKSLRNYQIRYYITGLTEPPFILSNARRKFLGKGEPVLGQWVYFETDLRRDFEELWGTIPEGYEYLRVLFEARWDNRPGNAAVRADVCFDDLFFGYGKPVSTSSPPRPPPATPAPGTGP